MPHLGHFPETVTPGNPWIKFEITFPATHCRSVVTDDAINFPIRELAVLCVHALVYDRNAQWSRHGNIAGTS